MPQDIFGDHFPIEVEFHELESVEIRIVGAIPAEIPQLTKLSSHSPVILGLVSSVLLVTKEIKTRAMAGCSPYPLRMEHFYFPLGTWLIGLFLSVFCLLAEIIFHCLTTRTDVPPAVLEEPGVAQSNTKLKDGHNSDAEDFEDTEV